MSPEQISALMLDAVRWRFCQLHGFPVRNQNDYPQYTAYGEGNHRGGGATPNEAVDDVMKKMGLIK